MFGGGVNKFGKLCNLVPTRVFKHHWSKPKFSYMNNPRPDFGKLLVVNGQIDFVTPKAENICAKAGDIVFLPKHSYYEARFRIELGSIDNYLINFEADEDTEYAKPMLLCENASYACIDLFKQFIDEMYNVENMNFRSKGLFYLLLDTILNTIIDSNATTTEEALELATEEGTINDLIVAKTSKIGEKLSFRRFEKVTKNDDEVFGAYIHMGGKIAVLTVLNGSNEETAKDVAMHAAAMRPTYVTRSEVPTEEIEKERAILKEQAINEGKPAEIAEKMVEGWINKYYKEVCLEEQPFVKDGDITVATFVKNNGGSIKSMYRFEVGEGMAKREENFAEEVAKQMGK